MGKLGMEIEKGLYLGIDFGTTNSVASIYNYDSNDIYTVSFDGSNILPSAIQFEKGEDGSLKEIFGILAKEGAVIYPESTILSVKRMLSMEQSIKLTVGEEQYEFQPEVIVSLILGHIKEQADIFIRETLKISGEFSGCVITVPANSSDKQKKKMKDAAISAGFQENSVFLRLEPAAAALTYAQNLNESKTVMVYDFGGGTFDACVLEIKCCEESEPEISILATNGDSFLGGNDMDKIIMDMIYEEFISQTDNSIDLFELSKDDGISVKNKKMAIMRLGQVANQVKERLSSVVASKVVLSPFILEPYPVNINIEITRNDFLKHKRINKMDDKEEVFLKMQGKSPLDIIEETIKTMESCLELSGKQKQEIDDIVLVGGTSSMPSVSERIKDYFTKEPFKSAISPALSISSGAAYYCHQIMLPNQSGPKVVEKTIHPLGIEISGRRFLEVVGRDIEIPKEGLVIEAPDLLETNFDDLTSMAIAVYEATMTDVRGINFVYEKGMKRLGGTTLRGIPQNKKGEEKVRVVFTITQDNMLTVDAKCINEKGNITSLLVDKMY